MSNPHPLAGLVQYTARDLRPLAVKYANTVKADDSGTLTLGYEPFPDFDEQEVRDFKGCID